MEVEIKIDESFAKPKAIIYTRQVSPEVTAAVNRLIADAPQRLTVYRGEEVLLIQPEEVFAIRTEGQRVMACLENGTYRLKSRLYELEDQFAGTSFVRISNSEIINFDKVVSLDLSISGTISLRLKNGGKAFVSRRYMDKIKNYLNL
jgi:DNA-binding LytR/AlgR family response regulator